MPSITADRIVGRKMYAKRNVYGYNLPDKPNRIIKTFQPGQLIGTVYSWVQRPDGLYWMFDIGNVIVYVKHVTGSLDVPELPTIIAEIEKKAEKEKFDQLGPIRYYVEKYGKYIVGAVVLAIIIPTLRRK